MNIKYGNLLAVALTAFLFVSANSSCASGKVESQAALPAPVPAPTAEERGWRPGLTGTEFPDKLPADLPRGAIKLVPSTIGGDIVKYKDAHPAAPGREIAEYGNSLLSAKGYNYWIDVDALNQKKKNAARILSNDFQTYPYTMTLSDGKKESFLVFAPRNDSCCCGHFYADFPVTRITGTSISFISDGKTYTVIRPKDLAASERYALVDIKNPSKEIQRWQVPYETYPSGISEDGTKLYVEGPIEDVLLEISLDGTFRLVDKTEVKSSEGEFCLIPENGKDGYEGCMKFEVGTKVYYIRFSAPCT
jgi:hypothetical protein